MKTTFGKLRIGTEFDYNIDADGHEPTLVKVSKTQAYSIAGHRQGMRETIEPNDIVYPTGTKHIVHTSPTDIERAAITMLLNSGYGHYGLQAWIKAVAQDPNEIRSIDDFLFETPCDYGTTVETYSGTWANWLVENGYKAWRKLYDNKDAFEEIFDGKHVKKMFPDLDRKEQGYIEMRDQAVLQLAYAIVEYRVSGRLDGDQTSSVYGLINVTTSLAAAVAEYHEHIRNALYIRFGA